MSNRSPDSAAIPDLGVPDVRRGDREERDGIGHDRITLDEAIRGT